MDADTPDASPESIDAFIARLERASGIETFPFPDPPGALKACIRQLAQELDVAVLAA